jgi:hypothetical protein
LSILAALAVTQQGGAIAGEVAKAPTGLPVAAPTAGLLLRHDFTTAADTAAGGIGTPDVGPGGAWIVTGPGAASARILGGKFVTPSGGVSYAYKTLSTLPDVIRARNIWTGASGPTIGLMNQAVLDTTTMNGPHIQTSKTAMNPFLFVGGTLGTLRPPTDGPIDATTLALANGIEYETRVDLDVANNTYTVTVTRVDTGQVLGTYTAFDAALSTLLGAGPWALFIEPDANVSYTLIEAYKSAKPQVAPPVRAGGGVSGPVGVDRPDLGVFDRLGVGTKTPKTRLHVVGSTSAAGATVESTHTSGAYLRLKSGAGADSKVHLQRNGEADGASTVCTWQSTAAGMMLGFGSTTHLLITRGAGVVEVTPAANNNGRLSIKGNGTGTSAGLELTSQGGTTARIYQSANVGEMRLATGGSDRVTLDAGGTLKVLGRLNVARITPTGGADTQGSVGDVTSDDDYVYVKTSTGWKRAALATW